MKIKRVSKHVLGCRICKEMARRGYTKEDRYWDDFFKYKEKKVKYKLI